MNAIDLDIYQEVMSQLEEYTNRVLEQCENIDSVSRVCASVIDGDPVVTRSTDALNECVWKIKKEIEIIDWVIVAMKRELYDIFAAGTDVNYDA